MRLFTFSSNPLKATIIFFTVIVVVMGAAKLWLLSDVPPGLMPLSQYFWLKKVHAAKKYDVVVMGDSRIYRGISPAAMSSVLKGRSVFNFGFSNNGFSRLMLEAGEEKLDRKGLKIIVLGVSPLTLTQWAALNEQYLEKAKSSKFSVYFASLDKMFDPKLTQLAIDNLCGHLEKTRGYFQVPHPDGWVESSLVPEKPKRALKSYKRTFTKYKISAKVENDLFRIIREQKNKGITVFGFRPPSSQEMEELEDNISGFNEESFKKSFSQAGGIWVDIPDRFGFASYDGSHLRSDSAKRLSKYLAQTIIEYTEK